MLKPSLFILEDKTYNLFVWFMLGIQSHRIKENFNEQKCKMELLFLIGGPFRTQQPQLCHIYQIILNSVAKSLFITLPSWHFRN